MRPHFIIIGAQKGGTTSLYEFLNSIDGIYMPSVKELQFFSDDRRYELGESYYAEFFRQHLKDHLCGEASPQYLCSRKAAERIEEDCPDTKLIAILRDPIERALSHYRMTFRRGRTSLTFECAIEERLKGPKGSEDEPDLDHDFLILGKYGHQLSRFSSHAEQNKLHVMFLEDIKVDPARELRGLQQFLRWEGDWEDVSFPHVHRGGVRRSDRLSKVVHPKGLIRSIARLLLTEEQRRALAFRFETQVNVRPTGAPKVAPAILAALNQYYKEDTAMLASLLRRRIPWRAAEE